MPHAHKSPHAFCLAALACGSLWLAGVSGAAVLQRGAHSSAELVAEHTVVAPGQDFRIALRLQHDPGWHSYWINPGDSGLATSVRWQLPDAWQADAIAWPTPERFEADGIVNYGYAGEVWLVQRIRVPAGAAPGTRATLHAEARWLVCAEICVAERASLSLPVRVESTAGGARESSGWAAVDRSVPQRIVVRQGSIQSRAGGFAFRLEDLPEALKPGQRFQLFPRTPQWLDHAARAVVVADDRTLRFTAAASAFYTAWPDVPVLLLRAADPDAASFEFELELQPVPEPSISSPPVSTGARP